MNPINNYFIKEHLVIKDLTTQLDKAKGNEAVFYRLAGNEKAFAVFKARLEKSQAGIIFVATNQPKLMQQYESVVALEVDEFEKLLKESLD